MLAQTDHDTTIAPVDTHRVVVPLAFDREALARDDFDQQLRDAVADLGGLVLFQMRLARSDGAGGRWMAAVAFGDAAEHELAIVTLEEDGTGAIEPADRSSSPIATIAPAFASLVQRWSAAA